MHRVFKIGMCAAAVLMLTISALAQAAATRPKVLVTRLQPAQVEELRRAVPEAEIIFADKPDLPRLVVDADALIADSTPDLVAAGKRLRCIQVMSAGVDNLLCPELVERPIVLTNMKIVQGPQIADHALALLLTLTRAIKPFSAPGVRGNWESRVQFQAIELRGKTALIIGLGGIGTQVAQRLAGFEMKVHAIDVRDVPLSALIEASGQPDELPEFLPRADVVFVCAPLTPRTRGMLGEREFALMKPTAYLVNVSRGPIVQTDALVKALREKRLAGAGLDVVDPEPLPAAHPLWTFDNVIITPHIANRSDQLEARRFELIKDNLRRFAKGLPLKNVVDKTNGY